MTKNREKSKKLAICAKKMAQKKFLAQVVAQPKPLCHRAFGAFVPFLSILPLLVYKKKNNKNSMWNELMAKSRITQIYIRIRGCFHDFWHTPQKLKKGAEKLDGLL